MFGLYPALSWAVVSIVVVVYFGAQLLGIGNRSGWLYLAASPLVGGAAFGLRSWLERFVAKRNEVAADASSDDTAAANVAYARRAKMIVLAVVAASAAVTPMIDLGLMQPDGGFRFFYLADLILFSIGATMWCYFDCAEHGLRVRSGYRFLVFLIPAIGFPVYALKTRGTRGFPLILAGALFSMLTFTISESSTRLMKYALGRPANELEARHDVKNRSTGSTGA